MTTITEKYKTILSDPNPDESGKYPFFGETQRDQEELIANGCRLNQENIITYSKADQVLQITIQTTANLDKINRSIKEATYGKIRFGIGIVRSEVEKKSLDEIYKTGQETSFSGLLSAFTKLKISEERSMIITFF